MIKINYFDERELLVRREIETKAPKGTQVLPDFINSILNDRDIREIGNMLVVYRGGEDKRGIPLVYHWNTNVI
jgi:hypothetical protein